MMHAVFGPEPLDDPLVTGWDAIVENDRAIPDEIDPADMALMRCFHSMEDPVTFSPHFFQNLEQLLAEISPTPVVPTVAAGPAPVGGPLGAGRTWHRVLPRSSSGRAIAARTRSIAWAGRWIPAWGAVAALAIMLVAGLLVLYHAVPRSSEPEPIPAAVIAPARLEPLVQFDFTPPMWGMPDGPTWNNMDFSIIELAPGKSFSTEANWYTSTQGPLLLMVLSGELSMQPNGPALFYPDVQQRGPPVEVAPGKTIPMEANQAIAYSIADTGAATNPGSAPMVALIGLTGKTNNSLSTSMPIDVWSVDENDLGALPVLPTTGATVSIQRLQLEPYDSFVLDPGADWRFVPAFDSANARGLQICNGAIDAISPNLDCRPIFSSSALLYLVPPPFTLANFSEQPIDIYFFVVEDAPAPTTP